MPGRYQFSLPERRQRDGWFRIGSLDVTTTALMVLLGVVSMFVYALSKELVYDLVFLPSEVRSGELWRLFTWPMANPPSIWAVITLVVFWFFGHQVEDRVGRKPYTWIILAAVVLPAAIVTFIDLDGSSAQVYGLSILAVAFLVVFALDNPSAQFFFNVPAWIIALVIIAIDVLQLVADRRWNQLLLELLVIAVTLVGVRQCGMVEVLGWIPRVGAGGDKRTKSVSSGRPKRHKAVPQSASSVITGPWGTATGQSSTDQIELDMLLDKISASGMASLSKQEKQRLNELSKRLRGG